MLLDKESFEKKNQVQFKKWSRVYDGVIFRFYFNPLYRHIIHSIAQRRAGVLRSGGSMLDIACGSAEVLKRLAGNFPSAKFAGIDLTAEMVMKAKEKTRDFSNIAIAIGNAAQLPFPDSSFDVVLISEALHHIFEPEQMVREVQRVLKKDGLFLLVDPAKETPIMILFGWLFKPLEKAYKYYSQAMLCELLVGGGFIVVEKARLFMNNFVFASKK